MDISAYQNLLQSTLLQPVTGLGDGLFVDFQNGGVQTREIDFLYDHNGMRTAKIVSENGKVETTSYTYYGKLLTHLSKKTVDENGAESPEELHFFYDAQNRPAGVKYGGANYVYIYDLQGSVKGIRDSIGVDIAYYAYDVWGRALDQIAEAMDIVKRLNPFRYRSYVYDGDTEMYYLQARYYLPENARFIGQDSLIQCYRLHGSNGMLYCWNTPPQFSDDSGMRAATAIMSDSADAEALEAELIRRDEFLMKVAHARALLQRMADNSEKWKLKEYVRYEDGRDTNGKGSVHVQMANERYLQDYNLEIISNRSIGLLVEVIQKDLKEEYGIELTGAGKDQLWGELRGHIWAYDNHIKRDSCAVIDIDVYSDGSVRDSRKIFNAGFWFFGKTKA